MARSLPKAHIVYLTRHGESRGNVNRTFLDPNEDDLTKTGELQVELLGKYLAKENVTRVYSSDYLRAYHTAQAILQNSKNASKLEVKKDIRLRERTVGVFQGKSYQDAITALLKEGGDLMTFTPHGAESLKDVGCRMSNFFKELCSELDGSDEEQEVAVVVSHSFALIKLVDTLIRSKSYRVVHWDHNKGHKLLRNGSFIKMSLGLLKDNCEDLSTLPGQRRIEFLNLHETEHLEGIQGLVENDTLVKFTQCTDEGKAFSSCIQS